MKSNILIAILLAVITAFTGNHETVFSQRYTVSDASAMTIYGSSNVRDWEAEVHTIEGEIVLRKSGEFDWSEADASWFEQVDLSIPVGDIDSGSRRMNNSMYDYLKKNDHPYISYEMLEAKELMTMENPGDVLRVRGVVTAAGESVEISHEVTITEDDDERLNISGSHDLRMTDFGIDPPTALLGTIRSRDEMTIVFKLVLE